MNYFTGKRCVITQNDIFAVLSQSIANSMKYFTGKRCVITQNDIFAVLSPSIADFNDIFYRQEVCYHTL